MRVTEEMVIVFMMQLVVLACVTKWLARRFFFYQFAWLITLSNEMRRSGRRGREESREHTKWQEVRMQL